LQFKCSLKKCSKKRFGGDLLIKKCKLKRWCQYLWFVFATCTCLSRNQLAILSVWSEGTPNFSQAIWFEMFNWETHDKCCCVGLFFSLQKSRDIPHQLSYPIVSIRSHNSHVLPVHYTYLMFRYGYIVMNESAMPLLLCAFYSFLIINMVHWCLYIVVAPNSSFPTMCIQDVVYFV
jgi:hypothetical protein